MTNESSPTFSGDTGVAPGDQPAITVKVYTGSGTAGNPLQVLRTTANGKWSVAASASLAQGTYTAQAQQSDAAGNVGFSSANTFTVDTTPPDVSLTSIPPSQTNDASPSFSFASSDPTASFQCALDGSTFAACRSPDTYANLPDGSHTFQVRAVDPAGNVTPTPASDTFVIDTVAPVVTVDSPASGSTDRYHSPAFSGLSGTASGDQPGITVTVYAGSSATGSPVETFSTAASGGLWSARSSALANGAYTVLAQQTDQAGNTGTATSTFTLDATPPNTTISSGPPSPSDSSTATFTFFSSVEGSTFGCRLDGGGWTACTSPASYSGLPDGSHTFQVQGTDPYGNTDPTGASATWTIDTSAPHTVVSSAPPNPTQSATAKFVFFSTRAGSTFQCDLDGSSWSACTSPATYTGVNDGQHTFSVRATDPAGRTDPTPATASWTVGSFLLSTNSMRVISGTLSGKRLVKPTINLRRRIASVGTAYCLTAPKQRCDIRLILTPPSLPASSAAAATARTPRGLTLGSVRLILSAGHHAALTVRIGTHARASLRRHKRIRTEAIFTLNSGRRIGRKVIFRVAS